MGHDLQTVLIDIQRLSYMATEHDQREFEKIWSSYASSVAPYVADEPPDLNDWLDVLERYLLSGPAYQKYASEIHYATIEELRRLEWAYDVWHVLAKAGKRVYARGKDKENRPWATHEFPLTASSRWFVKARLALNSDGPTGRIELFKLAAQEARQGKTKHCINRARHMEASALHYSAFNLLGKATDERAFQEAACLFEQARQLRGTADEGSSPVSVQIEEFFRSLCALQAAECKLDIQSASDCLSEALDAVRKLPNVEGPFRTPNPWTSLKDLENEKRFLAVLAGLRAEGTKALESAIKELSEISSDCEIGERKQEITTRVLVLKGLRAARDHSRPDVERYCMQVAVSLERPLAGLRSKRLLELLRTTLSGSPPEVVLSSTIPLLPLGLTGIGDPSTPTPLLYAAPTWLKELSKASSPNQARALLLWYVRSVLDYLWSVCERDAIQKRKRLVPRPTFADLPYRKLPQELERICELQHWKSAPAEELSILRADLPELVELVETPTVDFVDRVESLIRGTQRWLFPLVVYIKQDEGGELTLRRSDAEIPAYRYPPGSFDARAFDSISISSRETAAYVKPSMRRVADRPAEKTHKPLVLYPAPSYPTFSRTCLLVEGGSDRIFFEGMLDRVEPGWRALRTQADFQQIIEIRVAGGANKIPGEYDWLIQKGGFYTHDSRLEANARRIVVVVDGDKSEILRLGDLPLCKHRFVLNPDLERIAPTAFTTAIEANLKRVLDHEELAELKEHLHLSGKAFAYWIENKWHIRLKSQDSYASEGFSQLLATYFPLRQHEATWNVVWDVCERVLQLAHGRRMSYLAKLKKIDLRET
jgi:hypothetical protein